MMKYNNKILWLVLVFLIVGFVLSRLIYSPTRESNMRDTLIEADTSAITEVRIIRPNAESVIKLSKKEDGWKVIEGNQQQDAMLLDVQSMLQQLAYMPVQRVVSKNKKKWRDFQVGDSLAIDVVAYVNDEKVTSLKIGKIGFSQTGRGDVYTYVRLTGEDAVYTVKGFLTSFFDKDFDEWRDKTLFSLRSDDIAKISFNYPDSSFVLERRDSLWYIGMSVVEADAYVNDLESKKATTFADETNVPTLSPLMTIQIDGFDKKTLVTLSSWWQHSTDEWVLTSSLREGTYFISKQEDNLFKDIFVSRSFFISRPQ